MILVDVTGVVVVANVEIAVLLKERDGKRTLPIFVGVLEANSIATQLNNERFPRPLTHDLFKNVLDKLGCSLARIEVSDLVNNTFIGKLVLTYQETTIEIDSRPSDAISLALRFGAPIYVEDKVMDEAGKVVEDLPITEVTEGLKDAGTKRLPKKLSRLEQLKLDLETAVKEERYEDAARLRDEINKASGIEN